MRSLFLKIFLWFWATVIATGIALVLTLILAPTGLAARWHAAWREDARAYAETAAQQWERGGAAAATAYLGRIDETTHLRACLFDGEVHALAGRDCAMFAPQAAQALKSTGPEFYSLVRTPGSLVYAHFEGTRIALRVNGANGRVYAFVATLPPGPRGFGHPGGAGLLTRLLTALLVSGGICYLLTRYLTAPVLRLRGAARQLAAGDLGARAASTIPARRDELGDLVRDFDVMAENIEQLVTSQRQLISDVSHELRSPLARLNAIVGVARQRLGDDRTFDRMERELERLNEMIGRLLTLARLDMSSLVPEMKPLDLNALLAEIVADAEFEARERNCSIQLSLDGPCQVNANADLLRSAIENVVRNAIRYTAAGSAVEIHLQCRREAAARSAVVTIRDHGPGVPEAELTNIFRPFYRVADARDRQSGGVGLGLAIADRVAHLHGGHIRAENVGDGLQIELAIPAKT